MRGEQPRRVVRLAGGGLGARPTPVQSVLKAQQRQRGARKAKARAAGRRTAFRAAPRRLQRWRRLGMP